MLPVRRIVMLMKRDRQECPSYFIRECNEWAKLLHETFNSQ